MSPLTIFLAKLLGLYCIILALAMMTRRQSAVAAVKALVGNPPLLLLIEVLGLAGGLANDHRSQYLVRRRVTHRRHPCGMGDGDPRRRAPRPVAGYDNQSLQCLALRRSFLSLYGGHAGSGSLPDLCGFQRMTAPMGGRPPTAPPPCPRELPSPTPSIEDLFTGPNPGEMALMAGGNRGAGYC